MTKTIKLLAVMAGLILTVVAPALGKVVDLSGTWVFDPAHSSLRFTSEEPQKITVDTSGIKGGRIYSENSDVQNSGGSSEESPGERVEKAVLLINQIDNELQITRQITIGGKAQTVIQRFMLDGSQCLNVASDGRGEFVSRSDWKNGSLINTGTQTRTDRGQRTEISILEEYSISKDRTKLTVKTKSVTPRGVTTQNQVFRKME
jgi:hypothetical protein